MTQNFVDFVTQFTTDKKSPLFGLQELIETALPKPSEFDFIPLAAAVRENVHKHDHEEVLSALIIAEEAWRINLYNEDHPTSAIREGLDPCAFRGLSNKPCKNQAVENSPLCFEHGGAILDPDVRRSILLASYAKIMNSADVAVDTLIDVAQSGRNDLARVNAAKELLDRAGLVVNQNNQQNSTFAFVQDSQDNEIDPHDILFGELKQRLDAARSRLSLQALPAAESVLNNSTPTDPDDEPVDAEIIEDTD